MKFFSVKDTKIINLLGTNEFKIQKFKMTMIFLVENTQFGQILKLTLVSLSEI